ncbi:MAG: protein kinase [Acidobacteriota bacterium]|nr:protein kinase [Acidobacteriota bacterium]MDH3530071.1 protein kinase [Acidobacteriota bacterium]
MAAQVNIGTTESVVGRVLAGKYQVEGIIREDDFGTVYRGTHILMETPVTIKMLAPALSLDPGIVEKFSLEAKTISRLSHPNILNVTDFGEDIDGTVFMVLEHFDGETIEDLILREGAVEVDRAVRIARQVAGALSAAHSNRIFHSKLSSKKILVSSVGKGRDIVKLIDLGVFTGSAEPAADAESTIEEVAYLSPEQCSRESEADERSDIYSLGIVFYELLTGEVPFMADTVTDLMIKHADVPPPPLAAFRSDVPEDIEPILLNALAKDPDRRYQSAEAFAEDLAEAIKGEEEDDTVVIPNVNADAGKGRDHWKTAFIVLAGISLLAFGLMYWTGTRPDDPVVTLPIDADSQPVQPLSPATGINEQGNLMSLPPGTLVQGDQFSDPNIGGGDGYDPWGNIPVPRSGGNPMEVPVGPGGDLYTIPGGDGSVFMPNPDGSGVILVPKYVPDDTPKPEKTASPVPEKSPGAASPVPSKTQKPADKKPPVEKASPSDKPKDASPRPVPANENPDPSSAGKGLKSGSKQDS